jgi:hypothetical protein
MTGSAGLTGKDPAGYGRRRFVCAGSGRETGSWSTIGLCPVAGQRHYPEAPCAGSWIVSCRRAVVDEDWVRHAVPPPVAGVTCPILRDVSGSARPPRCGSAKTWANPRLGVMIVML